MKVGGKPRTVSGYPSSSYLIAIDRTFVIITQLILKNNGHFSLDPLPLCIKVKKKALYVDCVTHLLHTVQ